MSEETFHHELLQSAQPAFPAGSFLMLRRAGISPTEALHHLGFRESELSFLHRALLVVDPEDRERLAALGF